METTWFKMLKMKIIKDSLMLIHLSSGLITKNGKILLKRKKFKTRCEQKRKKFKTRCEQKRNKFKTRCE